MLFLAINILIRKYLKLFLTWFFIVKRKKSCQNLSLKKKSFLFNKSTIVKNSMWFQIDQKNLLSS